jgi:hypothetical protein
MSVKNVVHGTGDRAERLALGIEPRGERDAVAPHHVERRRLGDDDITAQGVEAERLPEPGLSGRVAHGTDKDSVVAEDDVGGIAIAAPASGESQGRALLRAGGAERRAGRFREGVIAPRPGDGLSAVARADQQNERNQEARTHNCLSEPRCSSKGCEPGWMCDSSHVPAASEGVSERVVHGE